MSAPKRIQRQRTKGWRMPEGAVYVGRPTAWGNPFPVGVYGHEGAVDRFRRWLTGEMSGREESESTHLTFNLTGARHRLRRTGLHELRGKDLVCWCPLDQPCHADVLLAIANVEGGTP